MKKERKKYFKLKGKEKRLKYKKKRGIKIIKEKEIIQKESKVREKVFKTGSVSQEIVFHGANCKQSDQYSPRKNMVPWFKQGSWSFDISTVTENEIAYCKKITTEN